MHEPDDVLSSEELAFIQAFHHRGRAHPIDPLFSRYIAVWTGGVSLVETGYELDLSSYISIPSKRSSLERAYDSAPASLRRRLDLALPPLDARFKEATWPVGESVLKRSRTPEALVRLWWECRLPKKLLPDLLEDLRAPFGRELRERGYI